MWLRRSFVKNRIFCILILFFSLTAIHFSERKAMAKGNAFKWDVGGAGIGYIYSDFDFNYKLFDLFFEHELSPFGLEIIPIIYDYSKFYDGHIVSFFNAKLYFTFFSNLGLKPSDEDIYVYDNSHKHIWSPFISIRVLNIPDYHSYNYIIDAGLKFAFLRACDIEIGSKYFKKDRNHTIYINLSTNLPLIFFI
jgi:hypothetical protein